jgi:hypothetical protein
MDKLGGSIAYAPTADDILFVVHLPLHAAVPQAL